LAQAVSGRGNALLVDVTVMDLPTPLEEAEGECASSCR
jgi:hypothetical protein